MNQKHTGILAKTLKVSVFTCAALGGAALIASGAAVKALAEGAKYLSSTIRDIISEVPDETEAEATVICEEAPSAPEDTLEAETSEPLSDQS